MRLPHGNTTAITCLLTAQISFHELLAKEKDKKPTPEAIVDPPERETLHQGAVLFKVAKEWSKINHFPKLTRHNHKGNFFPKVPCSNKPTRR